MNKTDHPATVNYFLKPGYIFLADKPTIISTVLGSCVSVCMYDRKRRVGAMNMFLYPVVTEKSKATAMYGNVSTLMLIRMMENNGSKKKHLEAQVIGGGHNPEVSEKNIGMENVNIALKVLEKQGIAVVSKDEGGEKGRKVVFNTATSEIAVFKVEKLRASDWFPYQGER
jgi:chemotaxis protein CheD